MQKYESKVMDDLDALLADLQSTTAQISHYQQHPPAQQPPHTTSQGGHSHQYQQQHSYSSQNSSHGPTSPTYNHGPTSPTYNQGPSSQSYNQGPTSPTYNQGPPSQSYNQGPTSPTYNQGPPSQSYNQGPTSPSYRRSETPPPLPPPPPQEILDSIPPPRQFNEPLYEAQNQHQDQTLSSGTSRSSDLSYPEKSPASPPPPKQMSTLTNNLSELDQLLQDLNSAQFMAEVDKRNVSNQHIVNGGSNKMRQPPPPVAPKPSKNDRNTVDSLLDQLETSLPERANNYRGPAPGDNDNYEYTPDHQRQHMSHHQIPPPSHAPSTATRELDDLMATLSEFKVSNNQQKQQQMSMPHARSPSPHNEPSYARPQKSRNTSTSSQSGVQQHTNPAQGQTAGRYGDQLDSMLGDLESDMSRHGVSTQSKGICGACNQPVVGQVITALGKVWHIEHFVCSHCKMPLGTKNFYERDGGAFCEEDYQSLFAPKCAYCNGPILDKCVTAIGRTWHPEHFFCAQCGRPFGEEGFHEKENNAYCREDYLEMFAPRCGGCGHPILDNYISALNRHWHPECFVCRECHMSFGGRSFFDHEGQPYCETHYHLKRGSLCASCQKPITGRMITAMYKKFHPEHFVCAFCLKQLNKGTFKEQHDKPYCHPCFVKLFG